MREDEALIVKAAALSHSSNHEWREFLEALDVFVGLRKNQCVESPPELLQRNQGRAQQAAEFVTLFRDAGRTADRIKSAARRT